MIIYDKERDELLNLIDATRKDVMKLVDYVTAFHPNVIELDAKMQRIKELSLKIEGRSEPIEREFSA